MAQFRKGFRGYKCQDVEMYFDEMDKKIHDAQKEIASLQEDIEQRQMKRLPDWH